MPYECWAGPYGPERDLPAGCLNCVRRDAGTCPIKLPYLGREDGPSVGEVYEKEIGRLRAWVDDLHSGMYINCVYCGHRYGPDPGTPVAMAEVLKQHVERCPEHPLSALRRDLEEARAEIARLQKNAFRGRDCAP